MNPLSANLLMFYTNHTFLRTECTEDIAITVYDWLKCKHVCFALKNNGKVVHVKRAYPQVFMISGH